MKKTRAESLCKIHFSTLVFTALGGGKKFACLPFFMEVESLSVCLSDPMFVKLLGKVVGVGREVPPFRQQVEVTKASTTTRWDFS